MRVKDGSPVGADLTVIDFPPDARLPWLSRVLRMRARGHTGVRPRASKAHELHFISRDKLTIGLEGTEIILSAGQRTRFRGGSVGMGRARR